MAESIFVATKLNKGSFHAWGSPELRGEEGREREEELEKRERRKGERKKRKKKKKGGCVGAPADKWMEPREEMGTFTHPMVKRVCTCT